MDKVRQYLYYCLVGVISLVMLVFMPMLGTSAGLEWVLPTTTAGWIVYVICKLCSAGFNISLFHCFNKQGKLNVSQHEGYLEARTLLKQYNNTDIKKARSPIKFHRDVYGKKGLSIFITTLLGTIGLSQAFLTFDIKEFVVQLIALVVGIVMGVLQMKDTESFWTEEYLEYAKDWVAEQEEKAQQEAQNEPTTSFDDGANTECLVEQEISIEEKNECLSLMESNLEISKSKS